MRQPPLCDGCLEPIEDDDPWSGMDEFPAYESEDDDDDVDPVDDEDYQLHFHRHEDRRCVWAWAAAAYLDGQQ